MNIYKIDNRDFNIASDYPMKNKFSNIALRIYQGSWNMYRKGKKIWDVPRRRCKGQKLNLIIIWYI